MVPFSSIGPRGGVMVLLRMADELRLGLFMGTLWCENRGLGYLPYLESTQWLLVCQPVLFARILILSLGWRTTT